MTMAKPANGRTAKIWRDGQLVNWEDATIHVMSHVVHYGSSVFEGVRCYETPNGGAIFRAREGCLVGRAGAQDISGASGKAAPQQDQQRDAGGELVLRAAYDVLRATCRDIARR